MVIVELSKVKGALQLMLGGEFWRTIDPLIFKNPSSLTGSFPSLEEAECHFFALEEKGARPYAVACLAKRNYSTFGLQELLKKRHVSSENAVRVTERLANEGYINDEEWVRSFIRVNSAKKYGVGHIVQKLKSKKIPEDLYAPILDDFFDESAISQQIRDLLETKYKNRDLSDFKEKNKVIASLIRRGFTFEQVFNVL